MFRKLLLVCISVIAVNLANAQTEKGNQSLGLSFGFTTTDFKSSAFDYNSGNYGTQVNGKQKTYTISPNYNYFIADKLDVGVGIGYSYSSQTYNAASISPQDQSGHNYYGIVQIRKYFLYENKIGIRTGPYFSYQRFNQNYFNYTGAGPVAQTNRSNVYQGGVGLDFVYYPVKKLGLAASLGNISYNHQKTVGDSQTTYNTFSLGFANSLALSVNYVFGN